MSDMVRYAPGWPGIPARWTTSAKTGVGTSLTRSSRVWFTLSHGIVNEVYYPRIDQACIRDLGMLVTDGRDFFSEEKRHTVHEVECCADGVPAYNLTNTCERNRYRIEKSVVTDSRRDALLQKTVFVPLQGRADDFHLYALLAPHLGNHGAGNTGWVGDYKGHPMMFAERDGVALALFCSSPWVKRSVGFVGNSDGWQDVSRHRRLTWSFERAENGNVALIGEIDVEAARDPGVVVALGFGRNDAEAGQRALAAVLDGFDTAHGEYVNGWQKWQETLKLPAGKASESQTLVRHSAAVLRTHEAKRFPGGMIASLSIPWGDHKGDNDLGGYHLVWPRDLVESAGGLLSVGCSEDIRRILYYLMVTQEDDGHWSQNMWLDGTPYWSGIQMDETAFPILLIDLARREGTWGDQELRKFWPMIRRAAAYLVCNGPVTQQDRWEEDPGYSPFTLAVEVAALLVAAELAELNNDAAAAEYLRDTADTWNENIERWTYITNTDLARHVGVEGYYVRVAGQEVADAASPTAGFVPIKNRPPGESYTATSHLVSPDALALVRFGLRAPEDPRIVNTVKVIDSLLKVETPQGWCWHRYNDDGYGEHDDGSAFDGTGVGRAWPLLTGERAHYELAAGRKELARQLLHTLEAFANEGNLLPEQIWDADDMPQKELFRGRPSGSAMPLVWAHAEYLKLRRSLRDGRVFDMPGQTVSRYVENNSNPVWTVWRFNHKSRVVPHGRILRIETLAPAIIRWSADNWQTVSDLRTGDTTIGIHVVDLPTSELRIGQTVYFTFQWTEDGSWENVDYSVEVRG